MLAELADNVLHNMFKPLLAVLLRGLSDPDVEGEVRVPEAGLSRSHHLSCCSPSAGTAAKNSPSSIRRSSAKPSASWCSGFVSNTDHRHRGLLRAPRAFTKLRKIDAATVAGYYGSDSAGTFVTCLGVLAAAHIAFASYMPVMLAVMEIPGCLVALFLVAKMRNSGMDARGNMPGERGYGRVRSAVSSFDAAVEALGRTARRRTRRGGYQRLRIGGAARPRDDGSSRRRLRRQSRPRRRLCRKKIRNRSRSPELEKALEGRRRHRPSLDDSEPRNRSPRRSADVQ